MQPSVVENLSYQRENITNQCVGILCTSKLKYVLCLAVGSVALRYKEMESQACVSDVDEAFIF